MFSTDRELEADSINVVMASFGKTLGKIGSLGQYGMDPGMSVFLQPFSN